jgi:hypothetical protein
MAAFLNYSNKAHDIAYIRRPEPGTLHHVAFWLEPWHEVGRAADLIACHDMPLDFGPTRHGITRGQTIYSFDPSGNRNEAFSGGFIYHPDNPPRVWSMDKIGKAIFYQCEPPFDDVGRTRNRRQRSCDQPAGGGFRGCQPPGAGTAGVENRLRKGSGFQLRTPNAPPVISAAKNTRTA